MNTGPPPVDRGPPKTRIPKGYTNIDITPPDQKVEETKMMGIQAQNYEFVDDYYLVQ